MRVEYDIQRDLLYIWVRPSKMKAAKTVTLAAGIHADFDAQGKLIGIEILDASELLGKELKFEVKIIRS